MSENPAPENGDAWEGVYDRFARPVPAWYTDAKLGIFVHWGVYAVPAWAEPIGELGTFDGEYWMKHNPYAEWYANTIRIDGSPAQQHQAEVHGGAPYDDFLDQWHAEEFDADDLARLFARAGARYVVPTTKHHDGITLWDAPGTGERNTVRRGPGRDLVEAFATASRAAGLKFGVYYSGGLDWWFSDFPPLDGTDFSTRRPVDAAYNEYAYAHVQDLVEKFAPDVLWGDIEWPDAGKPEGPHSFANLLDLYYGAVPEGVVNDRFGTTHHDFRTSEYQAGREHETDEAWENCRGVGYSFGYNQVEDASHYMDGPAAVKHLLDVVARGGNFLLNVGPDAAGRIPELQRRCLDGLGDWMELNSDAVHGTRPVAASVATPSEEPWVRWTQSPNGGNGVLHAVVDASGRLTLPVSPDAVDVASARTPEGKPVTATVEGSAVVVDVPAPTVAGPAVVSWDLR